MPAKERRYQRARLTHPLRGNFGTTPVQLVDVSLLGARVEHTAPLSAGSVSTLTFPSGNQQVAIDSRVVRCKLERFRQGADGLPIYASGLLFTGANGEAGRRLHSFIAQQVTRELEEMKVAGKPLLPVSPDRLPILRGGVVDGAAVQYASFIACKLDKSGWKRVPTEKPSQPREGFTVGATDDSRQIDLLCRAYKEADDKGRRLIQLLAELSILRGMPGG
ncbi:MAG TPA: PilZ domain-containing protein [Thermoanaerobaculia bacterium]